MKRATERNREVAVPAKTLAALGRALRAQSGSLAAIHTLHAAGYDSGGPLFDDLLRESLDGRTAEAVFWDSLSRFLERRGWGRLEHSAPHPGIGLLMSRNWAEAEGAESSQPSCAFTVGFLSYLLTHVADDPVAVLEVACRASGAESCDFAFGSQSTIHDLYGMLLEGGRLEQALATL
jgi:hypothetical protein